MTNDPSSFYREQDLRVDIVLLESSPPTRSIVFDIGVLALCSDGQYPQHLQIKNKNSPQIEQSVEQHDVKELKEVFQYPFHLYTVTKESFELPLFYDHIQSSVKTLILTSSLSDLLISQNQHPDIQTLLAKLEHHIIVYTYGEEMDLDNIHEGGKFHVLAEQKNSCVFCDPEHQGKALYTFSSLLEQYPIVKQSTQIKRDKRVFQSCFQTPQERDVLREHGFSFWMESQTHTFLWDVYVGKKQAHVKYSYLILEEEVGWTINRWINEGQTYSDTSLLNLKGEVSQTLSSLKDKGILSGYEITFRPIDQQRASDKLKGIVRGFHLHFDEQYRIASISIMISGGS